MSVDPVLGMVAQGGTNAVFGYMNNALQREQQELLNGINFKQHKRTTDYNLEKQMELWERTGFKPTVDQMKAAGLNPALMYKGSGPGGSTALAAGQAGNAEANSESIRGMDIASIAQLELLKAQKENIQADTKNKEAATAKTSGVDTDLTKGQLSKLAAETGNIEVQTEIAKIDEYLKNITKEIETKSMGLRMAEIQYRTAHAWEMLEQAITKTKLDKGTVDNMIETVRLETVGAALNNILTKAQTGLIGEQTKESKERQLLIQREVSNLFQKNEREWQSLGYEGRRTAVQEELSRIAGRHVDIQEAEQFMRVLDMGLGKGSGGRTVIEGFSPKKSY